MVRIRIRVVAKTNHRVATVFHSTPKHTVFTNDPPIRKKNPSIAIYESSKIISHLFNNLRARAPPLRSQLYCGDRHHVVWRSGCGFSFIIVPNFKGVVNVFNWGGSPRNINESIFICILLLLVLMLLLFVLFGTFYHIRLKIFLYFINDLRLIKLFMICILYN